MERACPIISYHTPFCAAMTDPVSDFIQHMRDMQIGPADPAEIIADDKRRRYRLEGDKPKTRNASYQLSTQADGFSFGWAMSFREGEARPWHSKSARKASPEDKAAWKAKRVLAEQARANEARRIASDAAAKAKRIWAKASKTGAAGYLERKGCGLHGARVWQGLVVVPMYGADGLTGLQFIAADGAKRFLTGSAKEGAYFPIATKDESKARLVICEGFATAAAIRVATGLPVVAAFDAGNLKPVATAMRSKYPDAELIIGADNDCWTAKPDGTAWNPGIEKAQQAAVAVGGARVIAPQVDPEDPDRRTDWDDIARSDGMAAVTAAFEAPQPVDTWEPDYDDPDGRYDDEVTQGPEPFRCLGHNNGVYYFLPSRNSGQVVELTAAALNSMSGIGRIHSSYDYWASKFGGPGINDRKIANFAYFALMDECQRVGVFRPESVRGAGAWRDGVRTVINDGRRIIAGDTRVPIYAWEGSTVYAADQNIYDADAEPLGNAEAVKLREICNALQWQNPLFGDLLAGWLVIAPFGSCLRWRPHVWLTGASGSGKSWAIENLVTTMLGKAGLVFGGVTEAGIRKMIGKSGRPFVLDEAEAETANQRENMQKILHLIRAASSGSTIGTAYGEFAARSCFMLASINVSAQHAADENRITQLVLAGDKRPDRVARFAQMRAMVKETITPEFVARMQSRTMANLDSLYANEATFRAAASELFGKQRNADQLAPMISGLYLLTNTGEISHDQAVQWLRSRDWSWHSTGDDDGDAHNFIRQLMTSRARYDSGGIAREATVGHMIETATDNTHPAYGDVSNGLRALGIKVEDGKVWIANNSPGISKLMERTSWVTWYRTLSDFPGADTHGNKAVFFSTGLVSKCRRLPLSEILKQPVIETEIPFEDDFR